MGRFYYCFAHPLLASEKMNKNIIKPAFITICSSDELKGLMIVYGLEHHIKNITLTTSTVVISKYFIILEIDEKNVWCIHFCILHIKCCCAIWSQIPIQITNTSLKSFYRQLCRQLQNDSCIISIIVANLSPGNHLVFLEVLI